LVAVSAVVCGVGLVMCGNLRTRLGAAFFGLGFAVCIVATLGFAIEYLARTWVETRRGPTAAYQFTLAGLLGLITGAALLFALIRILGFATIPLLLVGLVILACIVEFVRRSRAA
jgi:hypothetical protein